MAKVNGAASTLRKAKVPKPAEASNESTKHEEKTAGDVSSDDDSSTSASEDEEEGQDVSKKGLARLMQALGEDGLSEMDRVHLGIVTGEGEGDEDEEFDDDEEDDEDEFEAEEDEEISIDDANDDSQDEEDEEEDAVPASGKGKDSLAASLARSGLIAEVDEEDDEEMEDGEDEDDAVPLDSFSEAALAALPDTVRLSRVNREKINNEDALRRIRQDIALGSSSKKGSLPWIETLVVSYDKSIEEELGAESSAITDDDLKRELEFYKQALYTAVQGRQLAKQADLPFTRPSDYFAEMVKSDEHMERVRQKLLDERAGLKASEEAKRQRELKKFGKKVQVEKQLERTRSRKELDEKVKGLKRKRKGGLDGDGDGDDDGDDFDIQLESAITGSDKNKRSRGEASPRGRGGAASRGRGGGRMSRDSRDAKFGFGGKKRHAKENTRESTNDMSTGVYRGPSSRGSSRGGRGGAMRGGGRGAKRGGGRGGRGAAKRPGKARRSGSGRS